MAAMPETDAAPDRRFSSAEIELAERLATAMMGLGRQMAKATSEMGKVGIDKTSMVLLGALTNIGPLRSSALAEAVYSDPSTISRQVATLVRDGLIERRADPEDGRASLLAVTDEGRRLLERQQRNRSRSIAAMLSHWSTADREKFVELLQRFVEDHERYLPTLIDECAKQVRSGGEY